jgi:hypothetical protein
MKWITVFLLLFSFLGEARQKSHHKTPKMDIGRFTIQFYRIRLNQSVTIQNISTQDHFYIVEGTTNDKDAVFYLSRNLLRSRMLREFQIRDTLLKFSEKKFKLYLKTENKRPENDRPWVKVTRFQREDFEKHRLLSGECYPNNIRVVISGEQEGVADCSSGQWSIRVKKLSTDRVYFYARVADSKRKIHLDGISLIKKRMRSSNLK